MPAVLMHIRLGSVVKSVFPLSTQYAAGFVLYILLLRFNSTSGPNQTSAISLHFFLPDSHFQRSNRCLGMISSISSFFFSSLLSSSSPSSLSFNGYIGLSDHVAARGWYWATPPPNTHTICSLFYFSDTISHGAQSCIDLLASGL